LKSLDTNVLFYDIDKPSYDIDKSVKSLSFYFVLLFYTYSFNGFFVPKNLYIP